MYIIIIIIICVRYVVEFHVCVVKGDKYVQLCFMAIFAVASLAKDATVHTWLV